MPSPQRKVSWQYGAYRQLLLALDLVFPPECVSCHALAESWCANCRAETRRVGSEICSVCGRPHAGRGTCSACDRSRPAYQALRGWAIYAGAARKAVLQLKYRPDLSLAATIADQLAVLLVEVGWPVGEVMPVPLSRARHRQRGYNQAALIAWPIAKSLGLGYLSRGLRRTRETRSQVGLTGPERMDNVRGVFVADPTRVQDKTVLLVDDVATTGATLSAAAVALLAAGARSVYGLTVARAVDDSGLQDV